MPVTVDPALILSGQPGVLYHAPLATANPTNTVVASVFTDTWPTGWTPLGPTDAGTTFSNAVSTANVEVAEQLTPVKIVTTGRADSIAFALENFTLANYRRTMNAGTGSVVATSGTGTTALTTFSPPIPGTEVRCMIGWQSDDNTLRLLCYQCFQTGSVSPTFNKGNAKASLAVTFSLETPASGIDFNIYAAGASRVGV